MQQALHYWHTHTNTQSLNYSGHTRIIKFIVTLCMQAVCYNSIIIIACDLLPVDIVSWYVSNGQTPSIHSTKPLPRLINRFDKQLLHLEGP